jgi:hypothetical protein
MMPRKLSLILLLLILLPGWLLNATLAPILALAQTEETPTPTETNTPQEDFKRPLVVLQSYTASTDAITPGKEFNLEIRLINKGEDDAANIIVTFPSGDFFPRATGGVLAVDKLDPGDKKKLTQPLTTSNDLWGKNVASLTIEVNYTDRRGLAYHESFVVTFPIAWGRLVAIPTQTPTPTITPTPSLRPQLVITSYNTNLSQLQPGSQFSLELSVQNLGNALAKRVVMIVGGGSSAGGSTGTEVAPGGVSGGSADFTNFAPLNASNVQSLGDLAAGATTTAHQSLIVNVSTNPGAYPLKISFTYFNEQNIIYTDDQVITMLVYSIPLVEIGFYRDPGPLMAEQPNLLPLQVTNLSRKSALLGNLRITAEGVDFTNNVILIGNLEAGGYFTLDATATPHLSGPLELLVEVNFTDDFNQARVISHTLSVEVMEAPPVEPGFEPGFEPGGPGFEPMPPSSESFWQKTWRLVRGLLGLDSAPPTAGAPGEGLIVNPEGNPSEGKPMPVP